MSLHRYTFISIIILLLCVDIALCITLLNNKGNIDDVGMREQYMHIQYLNASIKSKDIIAVLSNIGLSTTDMPDDEIIMIIPPHACGACILAQEDCLLNALNQNQFHCSIIYPKSHERETVVRFYDNKGVHLYPYEITQDNSLFDALTNALFFTIKSQNIEDIYVSSATFPEITSVFLENQK